MVTLAEILRWIVYTATRLYNRLAARLLGRDRLLVGSERKFRALLENAPDPIVIINHHGHIEIVNAQAERLFGYARDELIGQNVTELVPNRYRPWHREHQKGFMQDPSARRMGPGRELYGRRKDGSEIPVEISLGPLRTDQGLLVSAVIRDVTERVRTAAELERRADALERSNTDLEQFAYVASHDLQSPLRVVSGLVGALKMRYENELDEEADELLERAVGGLKRMQLLVDDLLAYSRLSRSDEEPQPVSCDTAVEQVLRALAPEIDRTGAEITISDLPVVVGTPTQVEQVFQNVIGNALKFSRNGAPKVDVSAEPEHNMWRISVRDNGIGIEPEHTEAIFAMFHRLHGADEFPGTGIGLAICKRIIEERGGEIRAEPGPGGGTIFSFTFPAADTGT